MDLDEMKQIWANHDQTLEQSLKLNRRLLSTAILNKAQTALRRMITLLALEAIGWLVLVASLGGYIYRHVGTPWLSLSAAALDMYSIGMLAATIRLIVSGLEVDYMKPVMVLQKQIETLRMLRIRITQRALLVGTIVWAPSAVVACKVFLGLDVTSAPWLWTNVGFGLALIPLTLWLSRRFSDQMDRSPFVQQIMRDIAGCSLNAATASLSELSAFESSAEADGVR